jgi:hypothetical protein
MQSDESSEPSQQVNIDVGSVTASDSATVNIAGGHIIQAAAGATVIIGAQAGAGLQALSDLVKLSPEVRAAVGTFSADFKAAISQVDVMGDYKDLHDLLHQIQFNCYTPIIREATYFPDDRTLESFPQYERDLRNILSQLSDVSGRQRVTQGDTAFIQQVELAHTELKSSIDQENSDPLLECIKKLRRVLTRNPVIINTLLIGAARALRMDALIKALVDIQKELLPLKVDSSKVAAFEDGIKMLQSMNQRLQSLLADHEKWQAVDGEIRLIEAMTEQDLGELIDSWDDLKTKASPLYKDSTETWAVSIQRYADQLDQFIAANNTPKIRSSFRNFIQETALRFFQVDISLKALCSELRQIGEPLSAIIRSLE